jgi:hypothetical protein
VASLHAIVFRYLNGTYVALAEDVECFEVEKYVTGAGTPVDLDLVLGARAERTDSPLRRLLISPPANKLVTTTAALQIEVLDTDRFFLLPWLLRQASLERWVRGVVELDRASDEGRDLGVWIDLRQLARR